MNQIGKLLSAYAIIFIYTFAVTPRIAICDSPFKMESESGEVVNFDGTVKLYDVFTPSTTYIPPAPNSDTKTSEQSQAPPPKAPGSKQTTVKAPSLIKARPSVIVSSSESIPQSSNDNKDDKLSGKVNQRKKPVEPTPALYNDPDSPPATTEKAPAAKKQQLPDTATKPQYVPASSPFLPIVKGANLSILSGGIEYNQRTKTLKAKHSYIKLNNVVNIESDESVIDLFRGLIAASGNVSMNISNDELNYGTKYVGDSLLIDVKTFQAMIVDGKMETYISPAMIGPYHGATPSTYEVFTKSPLLPSAGGPSIAGLSAADIIFTGEGTDVIKSLSFYLYDTGSIILEPAIYTDSYGKSVQLPFLYSNNGQIALSSYRFDKFSFTGEPATGYLDASISASAVFNKDPRRVFQYSAGNEIIDNKFISYSNNPLSFKYQPEEIRQPQTWKYNHSISKLYIQGLTSASVSLNAGDHENSAIYSIKQSFFPGPGGASLLNVSYIAKSGKPHGCDLINTDIQPENTVDAFEISFRKAFNNFQISASAASLMDDEYNSFGIYSEDYSQCEYIPINLNMKGITTNTTVSMRPLRVNRTPFFVDGKVLQSYKNSKIMLDFDNLPFISEIDDRTNSLTYIAGVTAKPIEIGYNIYITSRADWNIKKSSSDYSLVGYNYVDHRSTSEEMANGVVSAHWKASKNAVAGADYIWRRQERDGYSAIAPFLSYRRGGTWSIRLSGRYHQELERKQDVLRDARLEYSRNIGDKSHMMISFDVNNNLHDYMFSRLELFTNYKSMTVKFTAAKEQLSNYSISASPNRYSIDLYPK